MTTQISDKLSIECALFNMKRADRAISKIYAKHLSPVGLKGTQFTILMVLSNLSDATISMTAELLVMDRTTLTRALKPLERDGLVEVIPGEEDRRIRYVSITTNGRVLLERAIPLWKQAQAEFFKHMGKENWKLMKDLLEQVSDF